MLDFFFRQKSFFLPICPIPEIDTIKCQENYASKVKEGVNLREIQLIVSLSYANKSRDEGVGERMKDVTSKDRLGLLIQSCKPEGEKDTENDKN